LGDFMAFDNDKEKAKGFFSDLVFRHVLRRGPSPPFRLTFDDNARSRRSQHAATRQLPAVSFKGELECGNGPRHIGDAS
jgi:hypothetical protein